MVVAEAMAAVVLVVVMEVAVDFMGVVIALVEVVEAEALARFMAVEAWELVAWDQEPVAMDDQQM